MSDLAPGTRLKSYTVIQKLAEGSTAQVYLGFDSSAEGYRRVCAIKRLKPNRRHEPLVRELFITGARLAAQVCSPYVASVNDLVVEPDGEIAVIMDYVRGPSLEALRRALPNQMMPPLLAAHVGCTLSTALVGAHSSRKPVGELKERVCVVHRDISPSNVVIAPDGLAQLIDFGLAKPADTQTLGGLKGTYTYMAPEQALPHGVIDARTDVFSLGGVIYELCTGRRPFEAGSLMEMVTWLTMETQAPPRADALRPAVPRELADLLERALQRRPDDRFQSAEELRRAFFSIVWRDWPHAGAAELAQLVEESVGYPPSVDVGAILRVTPAPVPIEESAAGEGGVGAPTLRALPALGSEASDRKADDEDDEP